MSNALWEIVVSGPHQLQSRSLFEALQNPERNVLMRSWLNAGRKVARVAFVFPVGRSDPFERQLCAGCLVANGQDH